MKWVSVFPVLLILTATVIGAESQKPKSDNYLTQTPHSQNDIAINQNNEKPDNLKTDEKDHAPDDWSVGDKIALAVAIIAVFQFFALMGTYYSMQDTAQRQLRAYVGVTEGNREITYDVNGSFHFPGVCLHLVNYGKTTANNVRCFYRTALLSEHLGENFDFYAGLVETNGSMSLFPTQDNVLLCRPKAAEAFTQVQMDEIFAPMGYVPHKRLFVYGHITYNDGFTDDRQTNFCYLIWWRYAGAPRSIEKPGFYLYRLHNEAT